MKQFILASGEFVTTTGIYRMPEHPEREITLVYGDPVPTFQRKKVAATGPSPMAPPPDWRKAIDE